MDDVIKTAAADEGWAAASNALDLATAICQEVLGNEVSDSIGDTYLNYNVLQGMINARMGAHLTKVLG